MDDANLRLVVVLKLMLPKLTAPIKWNQSIVSIL